MILTVTIDLNYFVVVVMCWTLAAECWFYFALKKMIKGYVEKNDVYRNCLESQFRVLLQVLYEKDLIDQKDLVDISRGQYEVRKESKSPPEMPH